MLSEFDIIASCFNQPGLAAEPGDIVRLGIGDDCALMSIPAGKELAVSMDTLVEDVHFPADAPAHLLGYRALAVNLSDLAAMGAQPAGFTLALTMPRADADWLQGFSQGLKECANQFGCFLMGGNTARGPLNLTLQVHGLVTSGQAITRSGAVPGDSIYVSGNLGRPALAIRQLLDSEADPKEKDQWELAFYKPVPRLALGSGVSGIASAGLDISDGLLADLGHICEMSKVGAQFDMASMPVAPELVARLPVDEALALALTGGEDYELVLTVSPDREQELLEQAGMLNVPLHRIGSITAGDGVICLDAQGDPVTFSSEGWRHFD